MKIEMASEVLATTNQVCADLEGETIVLHGKSGEYFGFDAVGTRIWQLVQQMTTVTEIVRTIGAEFDVEPDRCREDVTEFIQELESESLLEVR